MDETLELVTPEERDEILSHVATEVTATVEAIKAGRHIDGGDAAEIFGGLALLAIGAIVPPVAKPIVALVGPTLTNALQTAVEAAEARAREPERLAERIAEIDGDIAEHQAAIDVLQATPKRELFERVRIALRTSRINALSRKAARLQSYLDATAAE